ncbi:MAG: DUF1697 domain-containing protein [Oscillospiraceae bacterium]
MKRYIALLRGVNISGKNKIVMSELKEAFEKLGFTDVKTYLNSGNVVFSAEREFTADDIEKMINESFGVCTEVCITDDEKLSDILENAPEWWGTADKDIYDNLIFVIPPMSAEEISEKIGEPSEKLEKIFIYKDVIFWSFDRKNYSKANWWKKTASAGIGEFLTIRTANTVKKISELCGN